MDAEHKQEILDYIDASFSVLMAALVPLCVGQNKLTIEAHLAQIVREGRAPQATRVQQMAADKAMRLIENIRAG